MNKVQLIGRLGRDPEVRVLNGGDKVVNLRLATSERWKDKDGNRQERTEWHQIVIWNQGLGEVAAKYLKSGSQVYVEGQLQTRKWTDQQGVEKYATEVVLQKFNGAIELLGDRQGNGETGNGRDRDEYSQRRDGEQTRSLTSATNRKLPPATERSFNDLDDDIPF